MADADARSRPPAGVWLLCVCYMLLGLGMLSVSITFVLAAPNVLHRNFRDAIAFVVSGIALAGAVGMASIFIGIGLFRGVKSAWIAALTVGILGFAAAVGHAISGIRNVPLDTIVPAAEGSAVITTVSNAIATVVFAGIVVRYLLSEDVRAYCAGRASPPN